MPDRPEHSTKMKDCVDKVSAKGHEGPDAYAICTASLQKAGTPIFATAAGHPAVRQNVIILKWRKR